MAQSKWKLFLETYRSSNYSIEPIEITEDAERELQRVKGSLGANISEDLRILLKDADDIIRLSKKKTSFNSGKKQAKDALDKLHVYEACLKKKPKKSTKGLVKSGSSAKIRTDARESPGDLLERSKKAAAALVHDNPDITDLSDPNRPTKIADRFSELYDNEWTDAFEEKIREPRVDEKIIILDLLKVVKSAYKYCTTEAGQRIVDKTAKAVDIRNHYRKVKAQRAIPEIQESFLESSRKRQKVIPGPKEMAFMNNCVELCWWMCIQERPVYMCNVDGDKLFNRDLYRAYTKSGTQLDYIVWPALTLYEDPSKVYRDGPLLYRGIAQFM